MRLSNSNESKPEDHVYCEALHLNPSVKNFSGFLYSELKLKEKL